MDRTTPHQVLPPEDVERLAKEKIEEILKKHNLKENIDLVYLLIKECVTTVGDNKIDLWAERVVRKYDEQKHETEVKQAREDIDKQNIYSKK